MIGENGAGKSSTINTLLMEDRCKAGPTFKRDGITDTVQSYQIRKDVNDENIGVIHLHDTPPFDQMKEKYGIDDKYNVIILVFPMIRLTPERLEFLEKIRKCFDDEIFSRLIIIFNKFDNEKNAKEQVKQADSPEFRAFLEKTGESNIYYLDNAMKNKAEKKTKIKTIREKLWQYRQPSPIRRRTRWSFLRAILTLSFLKRRR